MPLLAFGNFGEIVFKDGEVTVVLRERDEEFREKAFAEEEQGENPRCGRNFIHIGNG